MKQGAVILHWTLAVLIFAVGFFILQSFSSKLIAPSYGDWQLEVFNLYHQAEEQKMNSRILAKSAVRIAVTNLASQGGFLSPPPCGTLPAGDQKVPLWNMKEEWCFPDSEQNLELLLKESLSTNLNISSLDLLGEELFVFRNPLTISSPYAQYTANMNFVVDIGYEITEYQTMLAEAQALVAHCNNNRDVEQCIQNNKESSWTLGTCAGGTSITSSHPFCIERSSPWGTIKYQLALDFSSDTVKPISFTVAREDQDIVITFDVVPHAEAYDIYFTSITDFTYHPGSPQEVFAGYSQWGVHKILPSELQQGQEECQLAAARHHNIAYLCDDTILYTIADPLLNNNPVQHFTVTVTEDGRESDIIFMSKI